jgi:hypothetical protein
MKFASYLFLAALFFTIFAINITRADDTNVPPRLTVELRDGSRLVGKSLDRVLRFRSRLLGDLKLQTKDIRSVDCASTNSTRLTTADGDDLTVLFVDSELAVRTGFGKVQIPVNSIRKLTVSTTGAPAGYPPGLVGLWTADGEGKDSAGNDDATLIDVTFADGMSGQAFSFNGVTSTIKIPASREVDVGVDDGFTLMTWINPTDVQGLHPMFKWLVNSRWENMDLSLWIDLRPDESGALDGNIRGGEAEATSVILSNEGVLVPGVFQHVAYTYDKASGEGLLYVNGVVVARRQLSPQINAYSTGDLWVSPRDVRPGNWSTGRMFSGLMNDIAIYNRALSASEIQSVCSQENHGQPLAQPTPSDGSQEQ